MILNGEIKNVNLQKKGLKVTLYLDSEDRSKALNHIANFVDKPIEFEVLIDSKKLLDEKGKITQEQRKKAYVLIKEFGLEYGEDVDLMKQSLKQWFVNEGKSEMFSLSDCSKELAESFIDFIIKMGVENGYGFAIKEQSTMLETTMKVNIKNKTCSSCGDHGQVLEDSKGNKICLCDDCFKLFQSQGSDNFIRDKHLKLVK